MVRELEVVPSRVDVDALAQDLRCHRGALNVPARAALAPRGVPAGLAGLGHFPQGKVVRGPE